MADRYANFPPFAVGPLTGDAAQELGVWANGELLRDARLTPMCIRILVRLIEKRGTTVRASNIPELNDYDHNQIRQAEYLTKYISRLKRSLGKENLETYVKTIHKKRGHASTVGYCFIGDVTFSDRPPFPSRDEYAMADLDVRSVESGDFSGGIGFVEDLGESREDAEHSTLGKNQTSRSNGPKFVLSVDGIIPNLVGELIFEKVDEETITECSLSYQRALEDFAFALVYGSQLRARWPLRMDEQSGRGRQPEPAQHLISALPPGVYEPEIFDDDLKAEPFLKAEGNHDQIRAYIRSMGQCLQDAYFVGLCRDLIVREAATYFGIHDSLFQRAEDSSEYHFGKEYYRHRLLEEVPTLIGTSGFATLLNFVPEYPHKKWAERANDRYDGGARVQFVNEIVLTHLATMHQFEKNAERHGMWRVPYAIRAEVTKRVSRTQAQRQLRNIVVRHALLLALRKISRIDPKELIIGVLASLRGVHPFNMIREMLEELSLLQLEPDSSRENRARRLTRDIRNAADPLRDQPRDIYSLARASVLKELAGVDFDEYKERLIELFPQLGGRRRYQESLPRKRAQGPRTVGSLSRIAV